MHYLYGIVYQKVAKMAIIYLKFSYNVFVRMSMKPLNKPGFVPKPGFIPVESLPVVLPLPSLYENHLLPGYPKHGSPLVG